MQNLQVLMQKSARITNGKLLLTDQPLLDRGNLEEGDLIFLKLPRIPPY